VYDSYVKGVFAMTRIRFERTLFIFRAGMQVRSDLETVKRSGWTIVRNSQFLTREPDGTKVVNLILRRPVQG